MDKPVRYRKAFYEKENDHHRQNRNRQRQLHLHPLKEYHSLSHTPSEAPPNTLSSPLPNLTATYFHDYGASLLDPAQYDCHPPPFLSRHQIDGSLRARMLDWMVEVTASYKFSHKTYFDGVILMDRYFNEQRETLLVRSLHVVGVQCMLIASKMNEVYPLKLRTVFERIAHKKIPTDELLETEFRIMQVLDFKLNSWSFFDLVTLKLTQYVHEETKPSRQVLGELILRTNSSDHLNQRQKDTQMATLTDICSYLGKVALYDYDFYRDTTVLMLAETVVSTALEASGLSAPEEFFYSPAIKIELCKQRLLRILRSFRQKFGGLNNIYKFSSREAVGLIDQLLRC